MASLRYASYAEEEDWDVETLELVNAHLEKYVKMLPGASAAELSLSELQQLAARQQAAMETQQQALGAREARLKLLQQQEARHRQLASESARLQRMRDKVEAQELKLKKLRAVRGQVEQYKVSNGNLNSELEAVRALFNEKEKELALAVSKVDMLMRQLQELREVKAKGLLGAGGSNHKGDHGALSLELERLRQELVHRNKLNEQQGGHLAAQRQLLQQRKEEAARMDERIHELQQRLKKRRSQQQQQQQPRAGTNVTDKGSAEQSSSGFRLPSQGWRAGSNVAAVEPYIQYAPKNVVKDDLYSKAGFQKQDPKYQTLPPNTKFIPAPDDGSGSSGSHKTGTREVNNNNEKSAGGGGGGGVKAVEYKIPALISSHFNAHRGQSGLPANRAATARQASGVAGEAKGPGSSAPSAPVSGQSSSVAGPAASQPPGSKVAKGPRPFVNAFGKSGLPKWPPEPKKEEEGEAPAKPAPHPPPHHPQINIFDEERQAGSGQSSPASSEGSGPLVKQGSGVFVHPLAAPPHPPPAGSIAKAGEPPQVNACPGQSGSSLDRHRSGPHEPQPPLRLPSQSASSASSADQNGTQPAVVSARTGSVEDSDPSGSGAGGGDSVSQGSSVPQGGDQKTGSMVLLNQRPAPTYRYASKNVIANTYMGRLGSSALARYQQLNKQLYSTLDSQGGGAQTLQRAGKASQQRTLVGELRAAFSAQHQEPAAPADEGQGGEGQGGLTQFGLVGAPTYPDIASDKGSFKANTPKHIRRRHSDSDNEDTAKTSHRGETTQQQSTPENASSTVTSAANEEAKAASAKTPRAHRQGSEGGGNGRAGPGQPGAGTRTAEGVVLRQKKTILKGDKRRKSTNRVSFDPLALLLDASLEGELDLVTRTAKEVADVSTPNDEGITALHNAICAGHYDIVKFLIEFGADVNSPDSDGWTPLHCAASCNNLAMVRFLVEHGACIFATTISDNETAAHKCEEDEDGYDHCSDYLYSTQEKLGIANDGVVYAVFDYYATSNDEVTFHINDKLTVLRKGDDVEKEWWWARLTPNREGYIPRNLLGLYPRVLPSSYKSHETSNC